MTAAPLYQETIPMRAAAFDGFPVRAGIDRGCSLTKIVFVPKGAPTDTDTVQLRCLTFSNDHFEDALRVMKAEAQLPDEGELHVTGVGGAEYRDLIKDIVGLDVVFIDEVATIGRGPFLLINNAEPDHLFHPKPKVKEYHIEGKLVDDFMSGLKEPTDEDESDDSLFPALVIYVGSGAGLMTVSKDGITKFLSGISLSGRPFIGLAKVMLGTNKYDEIMDLASKGDQSKVDFQVKDVMLDDPNYGHFPEDMPIFSFGKASNTDWNRDCTKEDLAHSLVGFFAAEVISHIFFGLSTTKYKRVYLAGNFFRSAIVRELLYEKLTMFGDAVVDMKALVTGHTGAIGAMLVKRNEMEQLVTT